MLTLFHLTSLGCHSVLIEDMSRSTALDAHEGQGGDGLSDVVRYSSKRALQAVQRYS